MAFSISPLSCRGAAKGQSKNYWRVNSHSATWCALTKWGKPFESCVGRVASYPRARRARSWAALCGERPSLSVAFLFLVLFADSVALGVWPEQEVAHTPKQEAIRAAVDRDARIPSPASKPEPNRILDTALGKYSLSKFPLFEYYRTQAYGPNWAGAIKAVRGGVISVNATGEFLYFDAKSRDIRKSNIRYENNRDEFLTYMRPDLNPWPHDFRFFDIAVHRRAGEEFDLLASFIYWHSDRQCYTFRVAELKVASLEALKTRGYDTQDWKIVFETEPCMRPNKSFGWYGHEGIGAMDLDGTDLYVGVGHFGLFGSRGNPWCRSIRKECTVGYISH